MLFLPRRVVITCLAVLMALALTNAVQVVLILRHPDLAVRYYSAPHPAPVPGPSLPVPPRLGWTYYGMQLQITRAAAEFRQSSYWMTRVARCESGLNPNATNAGSGAAGLFQFMWPTFWGYVYRLRWAPGTWLSPYNPRVASRVAAYMWRLGYANQWSCSYVVGYLYGARHLAPGQGPWVAGCQPPLFQTPDACWAWLPNRGQMHPPVRAQ